MLFAFFLLLCSVLAINGQVVRPVLYEGITSSPLIASSREAQPVNREFFTKM